MMVAATKAEAVQRIGPQCRAALAPKLCAIHHHHHRVNVYRGMMGKQPIPYRWMAEKHPARKDRILTYWTRQVGIAHHRYVAWRRSPWRWYYTSGARCVHGQEGGWRENNGNGYYGGFQYDIGTWDSAGGRRYASRADLATPLEQVIVTRQKVANDGWGAWPNTAAHCGLL